MSAAESEESRWPDLATASIRTHSLRSTVAQRSSSATEGCGRSPGALARGGGCGSGTGRRWLKAARLAADGTCRKPKSDGGRSNADLRPAKSGIRWGTRRGGGMSTTDELLRNNEAYAAEFDAGALPMPPGKKLAVLSCMDARVIPSRILGLEL